MTQQEMDYHRIEKAIRFLDEHAGEQPALADLARQVHLSEFHFSRLFKRWAGTTPKQFLACLTREHAKQLLREGASILEASHETGLSGPGRLHDLFVNFEAMTPGEYKQGGHGLVMHYGFVESPFGPSFLAATDKGLSCLRFLAGSKTALLKEAKDEWPGAKWVEASGEMKELGRVIFADKPGQKTIPLHMKGTAFQVKVWQALLHIPCGCLVSYGQLAEAVGNPKAARAVGTAVGQNPVAYLLPCHRVLRESGALGGYRWGTVRKQLILGRELIRVHREGREVERV